MLRFNVDGLRKSNTRYLIVKNILLSLVYTLEKIYTPVFYQVVQNANKKSKGIPFIAKEVDT